MSMQQGVVSVKNSGLKIKMSVKAIIAAFSVALAVGLPQLVHLAAGAAGGAKWLPMYLPVLVAGCVLGVWWGIGVAVASPLISFAITSAFGNAMPALSRLPYMIAELTVFAAVSGAFASRIPSNKVMAFPAVLLAAISGRVAFLTLAAIFQGVSSLTAAAVWAQIQTGLLALLLQALIVPVSVMLLVTAIEKSNK